MDEIILQAENLKKTFSSGKKSFTAVENISFTLKKGECLGIVGESGSGKSTVANMLTRIVDPTEGKITLMGEDITGLKGRKLKNIYRNIQMVFQMPQESVDPRQTLGDGISESLVNYGMGRKEARQKAEELLKKCGLSDEFYKKYPYEVSGGQCQRAAIARAIALKPKVIICDEATSALDVTVQKQVIELLAELKEKYDISFILISHDLALVQMFCDRVIVMNKGRVVETGTPDEIIKKPKEEYTKVLISSVL